MEKPPEDLDIDGTRVFQEDKEFYQKPKESMSDTKFELRNWKADNKGLPNKEFGAIITKHNLIQKRPDIRFGPGLKSHCVKSVQIWSFFWSIFSCIWTEYRKIKNSVFGDFSRSVLFIVCLRLAMSFPP